MAPNLLLAGDRRPRFTPAPGAAISFTSLTAEQTVSGVVPINLAITGTTSTPSRVWVLAGKTIWNATQTGANTWSTPSWDTTKSIPTPTDPTYSNYYAHLRAFATIGGVTISSPWMDVYTSTYTYLGRNGLALPANGSTRTANNFAADYSSKANFLASYADVQAAGMDAYTVIGPAPAPRTGNMVTAYRVPNSFQPVAGKVRWQTSPDQNISEGDIYYVGFSIFTPTAVTGAGSFPIVKVNPTGNHHIAIFQRYGPNGIPPGPTYPGNPDRGASFLIDAKRLVDSDPVEVYTVTGNKLNPGDTEPVVTIPYNRGKWTDVVIGERISADVKKGWVEIYLDTGDGRGLVQQKLLGRFLRLPRVSLWPMKSSPDMPDRFLGAEERVGGGYDHRTDLQLYRGNTAYDEVTLSWAAHKGGPTLASVHPHTYS